MLIDDEAADQAAAVAERAQSDAVAQTRRRAAVLRRTARALDWSAAMAEEYAHRRERRGDPGAAASELSAAKQARDAAERARTRAEELVDPRPRASQP